MRKTRSILIAELELMATLYGASLSITDDKLDELLKDKNVHPVDLKFLLLRYGLFGEESLNSPEIGERMSVTRERVRVRVERAKRTMVRAVLGRGRDISVNAKPIRTEAGPKADPNEMKTALPRRAYACLRHYGIHSPEDLASRSAQDLLNIPNFGPVSLGEVRHYLARKSLSLSGEH